jgi:hypothetical protein
MTGCRASRRRPRLWRFITTKADRSCPGPRSILRTSNVCRGFRDGEAIRSSRSFTLSHETSQTVVSTSGFGRLTHGCRCCSRSADGGIQVRRHELSAFCHDHGNRFHRRDSVRRVNQFRFRVWPCSIGRLCSPPRPSGRMPRRNVQAVRRLGLLPLRDFPPEDC